MDETFTCERCNNVFPRGRLKEVMYEQDRARLKKNVCPSCLDEVMSEASGFRGIVGDEKAAAIHVQGHPLG
jgi:hypothetical protein